LWRFRWARCYWTLGRRRLWLRRRRWGFCSTRGRLSSRGSKFFKGGIIKDVKIIIVIVFVIICATCAQQDLIIIFVVIIVPEEIRYKIFICLILATLGAWSRRLGTLRGRWRLISIQILQKCAKRIECFIHWIL
jgi:hypothetical protein